MGWMLCRGGGNMAAGWLGPGSVGLLLVCETPPLRQSAASHTAPQHSAGGDSLLSWQFQSLATIALSSKTFSLSTRQFNIKAKDLKSLELGFWFWLDIFQCHSMPGLVSRWAGPGLGQPRQLSHSLIGCCLPRHGRVSDTSQAREIQISVK